MPKLAVVDVDRNKCQIESAAFGLFTRQGYHGTSVREIAEAAGVSIGNIYNYYSTKEELFHRLVQRYAAEMEKLQGKVLGSLGPVFDPPELKRLAKGIREIVYDNPDYWRLMYVDVIEFDSRHFSHTLQSLATNMKRRLGHRLEEAIRRGPWNGIDPGLAFTAIYLQFFNYFLLEKLFGRGQHLGMPDDRAIDQLIKLVTKGLWRDSGQRPGLRKRKRRIR
jgi:AcrR family transcriptional regulator